MRSPLTPKQEKLYSILKDHLEKHYQSPTIQQLCKRLGTRWPNSVYELLNTLEAKGYILRRKNAKRNIELREINAGGASVSMVSVPVVASVGCDDMSVFADEQHDEFLDVDRRIQDRYKDIVAVRAAGDSMNDADINDGDYVLIQRTETAESGDRVATIVGDMITVKRLERRGNINILYPESKNPKYKPIVLHEDFKIIGKVIGTIPNPNFTQVVPINGSN